VEEETDDWLRIEDITGNKRKDLPAALLQRIRQLEQ
jgi:hypothetical protein